MTTEDVNLQPDVDEVLQSEPDDAYQLRTIPVCVEEIKTPVRSQTLPRKGGATRTLTVDALTSFEIARADHYRAQIEILSFDQDIYVAYNAQSAEDISRMTRWPAMLPKIISHTSSVWVRAATATTEVSISTELWAMGE